MCVVACLFIAVPGMMNTPKLKLVTHTSVKVSYKPPAYADKSKDMEYRIKYRNNGENVWHEKIANTLSQIVTGLDRYTLYLFTVAARYKGQGRRWGRESYAMSIRTKPIAGVSTGKQFHTQVRKIYD